jgi:hypothetical protein
MLSPLCRVFKITYPKPNTFLGYTTLQLFCIYNLCYM